MAVGGTVGVAGCSDAATRSSPPAPRERVTEFEARSRRHGDGTPLLVPVVAEGTATTAEVGDDSPRDISLIEHVTDGSDLEDLRFRDTAAARELEAFVTATDYPSRSVYLLQRAVGECHVPRLVGVYREGNGVDVRFCRDLRPAGVACDADATDAFAVALRLPFAGDEFDSVGTGWSSDCEHRHTVALSDGGGRS